MDDSLTLPFLLSVCSDAILMPEELNLAITTIGEALTLFDIMPTNGEDNCVLKELLVPVLISCEVYDAAAQQHTLMIAHKATYLAM